MEMEINLQQYVDIVLRRWPIVLAVFLVATLVATVVSFNQPSRYEASVSLVEETYEVLDTPRLSSLDKTVVKLYPTLAKSDAVEQAVVQTLESSLSEDEKVPGALLPMVSVVEDRDDASFFQIKVQADKPKKAVQIANAWAEQYVQIASSLQPDWGPQLEAAAQDLQSAEETLAAFERESGLGLTLDIVADTGEDEPYLLLGARSREFEMKADLLAEQRLVHDRLLFLLDRAEQARETGGTVSGLLIQLMGEGVLGETGQLLDEAVVGQEDLDVLISLLRTEVAEVSDTVDELALDVEELQTELVQEKLELERLVRARDLAEAAYRALSNQVEGAELSLTRTQVLSEAARSKTVGPNREMSILLSAALGLVGGILAAFCLHYLHGMRSGAPAEPSPSDDR
jgi:capsular polysaccharide biosynthesis protein